VVAKRRLPLLPSSDASSDPPRPRWQWVGFGAIGIIVVWLPLEAILSAIARRGNVSTTVASAVALGIAAFAGGFLLGRWGASKVGVVDAALAGLASVAATTALSWWTFGGGVVLALDAIAAATIAAPIAALGGAVGRRRRGDGRAS
jgi:hypothetical protein